MHLLVDRQPILEALREHVLLDQDVSEALTALHQRGGTGLAVVVDEARGLAGELARTQAGVRARDAAGPDFEPWLGAVLRGPHDARWFDARVQGRRGAWPPLPKAASVVLMGRVRQRLTELAKVLLPEMARSADRVADALARLFDLELALLLWQREAAATPGEAGASEVLRDTAVEVGYAIRNALGVIESSVYLVRRHAGRAIPDEPNIERHVVRISSEVGRVNSEVRRLIASARGNEPPLD